MKSAMAERLIAISAIGLALGSGLALPPAEAVDSPNSPIAGKATLGVAVAEAALIATGWRASKLLHAAVYNDQNQKIGNVDDFIVSPDGKLSTAVVDVGGFLGIGAHKVAIPVQQFGQVSPKIVLKGATKEALRALPEFKYVS
jgi:sporulation protein YlmC with PRC-barrel domain